MTARPKSHRWLCASMLLTLAWAPTLIRAHTDSDSGRDGTESQKALPLPALTEAAAERAPATPDNTATITLHSAQSSYSAAIDKGLAINGSAKRILQPQPDGTWLYQFKVDSFIADIDESVRFRWQDNRVIPLKYRYKLSGFMIKDRERAINYDWNTMTASGHYRGKAFKMDLKPGALDPLGYQLQLMQDIKAGKTSVHYSVTDKGSYDEDRFAVLGEEVLTTRLGQQRTIKAEKVRDPDSKRTTLLWFAPELDYLLVRLVQTETDGTRYEINVRDADIR
ncbi:DUF3108 domain-containing protein [Marinobacter caseinilyticus]|uniref:DUF3108 domain-containing protein n=1 Tax=Marinobacter caseinilyticus TaxID=2692195 RepID=UPI001407BD1B|nr:DUF3108 domain-containing protein [Marinobacter caseinilyticus]